MYTYRKVVNMKSNIINPMNRQVTYSKSYRELMVGANQCDVIVNIIWEDFD